jgi:hypothetical protein
MKVVPIVEGYGEVTALPVLLRRLREWKTPDEYIEILSPIRVSRDKFLNREEEFKRYLSLAANKCEESGWILVLVDADDDCPMELSRHILEKAQEYVPHRRVSAVAANREYEAWFIASADSLNGQRGFTYTATDAIEAEAPRDAKGWIRARMASHHYSEITDQPAFSQLMSLQQAYDRSRSFRKLCNEWEKQTCLPNN